MWGAAWHDGGVDDRALIDAVRAGDRHAFGIVVEHETAVIYRACLRILGRPHDAEDVTQESFVAAYPFDRRLPGRRLAARLAPPNRDAGSRSGGSRSVARLPTSTRSASRSSPTRAPIRHAWSWPIEHRREVRAAVARLPEPYREVVALRFFGELSLAEVGGGHRPAAEHRQDPPPPRPRATPPAGRRRRVGPMTRHPYGTRRARSPRSEPRPGRRRARALRRPRSGGEPPLDLAGRIHAAHRR